MACRGASGLSTTPFTSGIRQAVSIVARLADDYGMHKAPAGTSATSAWKGASCLMPLGDRIGRIQACTGARSAATSRRPQGEAEAAPFDQRSCDDNARFHMASLPLTAPVGPIVLGGASQATPAP